MVFGHPAPCGRFTGWIARASGWNPVQDVAVLAVYDRFPCQTQPALHAQGLAALGTVPLANHPIQIKLCRDKLASQRVLAQFGVRMPQVESLASRFAERLADWGAGFLKPQFGSFGQGVRLVGPSDALPGRVINPLTHTHEPTVLQRAVPPPKGWAGVSARVLCQREGASFVVRSPVIRRSRTDPVVNVSRGAQVVPAQQVVSPTQLGALCQQAQRAAQALQAAHPQALLAEVGVDLVFDRSYRPWCIEVNGRPRGRLGGLAAAWPEHYATEHLAACMAPLRWLALRS